MKCLRVFTPGLLSFAIALSASAQDTSNAAAPPTATTGTATASVPAQAGSDVEESGAELAKKLNNPISDLVSVPFQFNWENGIGSPDFGWGYFFASPEDAFGATWKVRGTITILFLEKKKSRA